MMQMKGRVLLAGILILLDWSPVLAHGKVPPALSPLEPGRVVAVMESDFLVPQGFRDLPGPMFYLDHEKDLGLTAGQRGTVLRTPFREDRLARFSRRSDSAFVFHPALPYPEYASCYVINSSYRHEPINSYRDTKM